MISFADTFFPRFERIKDKLGNFEGISEKELAEIETEFQITLPKAYRDFMLIFGKRSGYVLDGYGAQYPIVLGNRGAAEYVLNTIDDIPEGDKPIFKPSYFFFAQWLSYNYWFFDCDEESDDPKVYLFEDGGKIEDSYFTFTEFIYSEGTRFLGVGF